MTTETLSKVLKSYNQDGIFAAASTLFGLDSKFGQNEVTVRLTAGDANMFSLIDRRLARTQLALSAKSSSSRVAEFNEHLIGFTMALEAAHKHVLNKTQKSRHYAVYLTYDGTPESTPFFRISVKHIATEQETLSSLIQGLA